MVRLLLATTLFLLLSVDLFATNLGIEDPALDVKNIPAKLLQKANAVVRYKDVLYTIHALDDIESTVSTAITVLNKKGVGTGMIGIGYTEGIQKVKNLKIEIYDASGQLIKKVKKKELQDVAVYDGFSLANDYRKVSYEYISNSYPFTIKYAYTKTDKNSWLIPSWWPVSHYNTAVESSKLEIKSEVNGLKINQLPKNLENENAQIVIENLKFSAAGLQAIEAEQVGPTPRDLFPHVRFLVNKFKYYKKSGSITNWKEYGSWAYQNFLAGRGQLPPELIADVDRLIPDSASKEEIARIIYRYVTSTTRYVSVQLGIGGLQPFKCADVFQWKYGDCKALTFYTQNLLSHYGVESIYMEIFLDSDHAVNYDSEWPSVGQGNHIVLCLPNEGDTTYLECTSPTLFGYTHDGISNRRALLITPEGGKLTKTTSYTAQENISAKKISISNLLDNEVAVSQSAVHKYVRHERYKPFVGMSETKKIKYLKEYLYLGFPSFEVDRYNVTLDSTNFAAKERFDFKSKHVVERAGSYLMVPLSITSIPTFKGLEGARVSPVYIKEAETDSVELSITIPEGYQCLPSEKLNFSFENEFGTIESTLVISDTTAKVTLAYVRRSGTYDPDKVQAYNSYNQTLTTLSNQKIIFKPTN